MTIFQIPNSKCQFYYCKTITLIVLVVREARRGAITVVARVRGRSREFELQLQQGLQNQQPGDSPRHHLHHGQQDSPLHEAGLLLQRGPQHKEMLLAISRPCYLRGLSRGCIKVKWIFIVEDWRDIDRQTTSCSDLPCRQCRGARGRRRHGSWLWSPPSHLAAAACHVSSLYPTVIVTSCFEQLVSPAPGETSLYIVTQIQHKSYIMTIVYSDTVPPTRAGFEYAHSVKTRHTVPPSGPFSPVWR